MTELGDTPAARSLFERHLPLCERVAKRVGSELPGIAEAAELLNLARSGLWDAARRYDPERGVPFEGYAFLRCRGAIVDGIRQSGVLSRRSYERFRAFAAAHEFAEGQAQDALPALPTGTYAAELERRLAERLAGAATAMALALTVRDVVERAPEHAPEELVARAELLRRVDEEIGNLTEVEATLLRRHYLGEESLESLSRELGLSKSWASRLLSRAVTKLTRRLKGG